MSYRWNLTDHAAGYDAAAEAIHPYYIEIQDEILRQLPAHDQQFLLVDLGGGSGRLVERFLVRWPLAIGVVIDQSEPFLALAERRLARFGERAICRQSRLQEDWAALLPGPPQAIVSMSAIHHLEPDEKQALYRRCGEVLSPGGVLLNGDEIRDPDETTYLRELTTWAEQMRRGMADGTTAPAIHPALLGWIDRNVTRFGQPKKSGDDCHETIAAQLDYFRSAGFTANCPWQEGMWAVMRGRKSG